MLSPFHAVTGVALYPSKSGTQYNIVFKNVVLGSGKEFKSQNDFGPVTALQPALPHKTAVRIEWGIHTYSQPRGRIKSVTKCLKKRKGIAT